MIRILILNPPSLRTFTSTNLPGCGIPPGFRRVHTDPSAYLSSPRIMRRRRSLTQIRPRVPASALLQLKLRPRLLAARADLRKLLPLDLSPTVTATLSSSGVALADIRAQESNAYVRHPRRRTILIFTAAPVLGVLQSAGCPPHITTPQSFAQNARSSLVTTDLASSLSRR
ncbi:hypothetical protein BKA61DRAFT_672434 [Leptodontidium sp. MPI-SDFR-AT-0119]|nr:hypothetical protein BKA61DRAFT_672434 [Leptodontidium sp. MPI-SDFR-AT-0119]